MEGLAALNVEIYNADFNKLLDEGLPFGASKLKSRLLLRAIGITMLTQEITRLGITKGDFERALQRQRITKRPTGFCGCGSFGQNDTSRKPFCTYTAPKGSGRVHETRASASCVR